MSQNDIEDMLDHLRRIKNGGRDLDVYKIYQIEKFETQLRSFTTSFNYHHDVLPDSVLVKIRKKAQWIARMLHQIFDGIPGEYITNLNVEMLESHLLEFIEHNTSSRLNYELDDSYLLEYMEYLDKNLNDVLMSMDMPGLSFENKLHIIEEIRFLKVVKIIQKKMKFLRYLYATEINGYVDHEKLECLETRIQFMANNVGQLCLAVWVNDVDEFDNYVDDILNKPPYLLSLNVLVELEMKKIFLSELKASKFTRSKTFKDKKLPKGFSHHLHSLLMYLKNKKLENFPNNVSAQNVDVAVNFL